MSKDKKPTTEDLSKSKSRRIGKDTVLVGEGRVPLIPSMPKFEYTGPSKDKPKLKAVPPPSKESAAQSTPAQPGNKKLFDPHISGIVDYKKKLDKSLPAVPAIESAPYKKKRVSDTEPKYINSPNMSNEYADRDHSMLTKLRAWIDKKQKSKQAHLEKDMSLTPTVGSELVSSELKKESNKQIQRKKAFGSDANAPRLSEKRMKMMNAIKDYVKKKYGLDLTVAQGKRTDSGELREEAPIEKEPFDVFTPEGHKEEAKRLKQIKARGKKRTDPKPDWRSGKLETQPSPDAAVHEIAHLAIQPGLPGTEGMGLGEYQKYMDDKWGQYQKQYGHLQQKKLIDEIQSMAVENPIRRRVGLPPNTSSHPVEDPSKPVERALDNSSDRFVRGMKGDKLVDYMRQSRLRMPHIKELFDMIDRGEIKYHPETGWYAATNPDANINRRARLASLDPSRKDSHTLMRNEDIMKFKNPEIEKVHGLMEEVLEKAKRLHKIDPKTKLPGVLLDKKSKLKKDGPNLDPAATQGIMSAFGTAPKPASPASSTGSINPGLISSVKSAFGFGKNEKYAKIMEKCMMSKKSLEKASAAKKLDINPKDPILGKIPQPKPASNSYKEKASKKLHIPKKPSGEGAPPVQAMAANELEKAKPNYRDLKGVHHSGGFSGLEEKGQSQAGRNIERAKEPQPNKHLNQLYHGRGKSMHEEKLQELKDMPKPNLPKSEKMDKSAGGNPFPKEGGAFRQGDKGHTKSRYAHEKGVSPVSAAASMGKPFDQGTSTQRFGGKDSAQRRLKELRDMPKPNLPKSEHLQKPAPEGVSPEKYDSCVDQVKEKGQKVNAYAVCAAALKKQHMKKTLTASELSKEERGVHLAIADRSKKGKEMAAERKDTAQPSWAGLQSQRRGVINQSQAKNKHKEVLSDLKSMPKPGLPKSELNKDDKPHPAGSPEERSHAVAEGMVSLPAAVKDLHSHSAKEKFFDHLRTLKDKKQHRSLKNIPLTMKKKEGSDE